MQVSSFSGWFIFCPFPSWWSQYSGFCLNVHGLQSAGPPLLQGSKMALSRPRLPTDVSLMPLSSSAAVTGLWYHHLRVQLKCRFQKDRYRPESREEGSIQGGLQSQAFCPVQLGPRWEVTSSVVVCLRWFCTVLIRLALNSWPLPQLPK